ALMEALMEDGAMTWIRDLRSNAWAWTERVVLAARLPAVLLLGALLTVAVLLPVRPAAAQVTGGGKPGGFPGPGPLPSKELACHVLGRLTYGATDEDMERLRAIGADAFIRE